MSRDVGVGQLVEGLEQRGDRLPFEIGAFVALEACEGLLQESVKLEPDDVRVTLEGSVEVADSAPPAAPDEAARSLVSVLARLLVAAGPGVPPYLLQLVKESTTGQSPRGLRDLHDAIEASLIPINRGASRRVLARLVRESDRPPAPAAPQVDPRELDAELDELLRDPILRTLEPEPEPEEEPVTERIRIPRAVLQADADAASDAATATGADTASDADADAATGAATASGADAAIGAATGAGSASAAASATAPDAASRSFPPPVPDRQLETVPIPPSEPAVAAGAAAVPDLAPLPAPVEAQPAPKEITEPITATIRKWQPEEEPEDAPEAASAPEPAAAAPVLTTESVAVAATVSVSEPEPVAELASAALETPTESVFGAGSVVASESIPTPEISPERPAPISSPEAAYERPSLPQPPPKRRGGWGIWLLAAALGLGAYALIATGSLGSLVKPSPSVVEPAPSGSIHVDVTPADAQIFVFVGRGPAVAPGLAVSGEHEFIIFDRGLRPSRAVVPKGAAWTDTEGGPLYELAVQARKAEAPTEATDLGTPETEPSTTATGSTGTVRVITNPPSAKVYRFVGLGPAADIEVSSVHEGQEVLVYQPGYETRRAVIGPSDWQRDAPGGEYQAKLTVQLPALPGSTVAEAVED